MSYIALILFLRKVASVINLLLFLIFKLPELSAFLLPLFLSWRFLCSIVEFPVPKPSLHSLFFSCTVFNSSFLPYPSIYSFRNIFPSVPSATPILSFFVYCFPNSFPRPSLSTMNSEAQFPLLKSYAFSAASQSAHLTCQPEWKADPPIRNSTSVRNILRRNCSKSYTSSNMESQKWYQHSSRSALLLPHAYSSISYKIYSFYVHTIILSCCYCLLPGQFPSSISCQTQAISDFNAYIKILTSKFVTLPSFPNCNPRFTSRSQKTLHLNMI